MSRRITIAMVISSALLLGGTSQIYAADWCTGDPLPPDAKQNGVERGIGHTTAYFGFDVNTTPSKIWCMVHDDYGRSGQCVGLSVHEDVNTDCTGGISWVVRHAGPGGEPGQVLLSFENQHSSDWRYFTVFYK